ncbi:MAG: sporulation protein YabP [Clostridia bacterium]|nr:sporulation protein YabP [Clostridia bacterium]
MPEAIHSAILLEDKSRLKITGVQNVISITETEAGVSINGEILCIKGSDLKAEKLSVETGELVLIGNILSLKFETKKEKQGLFKRIFK